MSQYIQEKIPSEILPQLWNLYEKESQNYHNDFIVSTYFPQYIKNNDIQDLLIKSKRIMDMYGFKFKCSEQELLDSEKPSNIDYLVEFHLYKINGLLRSSFGRHSDDQAAVSTNVNTIIFYLEKDKTVDGGNLIVYDRDSGEKKMLEIKSGTMVILKGDVEHEIEEMDGKGERKSIVVQIQRD